MGKEKKSKKGKAVPHLMEAPTPEMMQAVTDHMNVFTTELIDLDMTAFCQKVEKENVGQLRVIRLFLEQKMTEVDAMCQVALKGETMTTAVSAEEKYRFATIFALLGRIESKRGFIDHLLIARTV